MVITNAYFLNLKICNNFFTINFKKGMLQIQRLDYGYKTDMIISEIKIYGIFKQPLNVTINNKLLENFEYDDTKKVLFFE